MRRSLQYCEDHENQTLTNICIANHNCNIKICPECQYQNHREIPQTSMIPFNIFRNTTLPTFEKNFNDELKYIQKSQLKSDFKQLIEKMENQFKVIIQTLKDQMKIQFNSILEEDKSYQNLIVRLTEDSLTEFSKKDLQKIISITQSDQFSNLVKERKEKIQNIEKSISNFSYIFQKFEKDFKQFVELQSSVIKISQIDEIEKISTKNISQQKIMESQMSILFALPCPYSCVCRGKASQQWKHSCGHPLYLSEQGQIFCKVCHDKPEKGCFIKEYPFKCSIAKTQQYYRYLSDILIPLAQLAQVCQFNDFHSEFCTKITPELAKRWDM